MVICYYRKGKNTLQEVKKMTNQERKTLEKLQQEYNELHEKLGYVYSEQAIRAINRRLDKICEKMNALLNK